MNPAAVKRHPLFALLLLASLAAVGTEGWLLYQAAEEVRRAQHTLAQRQQERDWLAAQSPALSEENAAALADDVAAAEKSLGTVRTALAGRARGREEAPSRPLDAYFTLASSVEKLRALALRQQVVLRPDEHFGFATHANEGPEPDLLGRVHLQRIAIEHLVTVLLEARPRAMLGVQRERPVPPAQRSVRRTAEAEGDPGAEAPRSGGVPADFFAPEAQLRLRHTGLVDTEAFRVEFTGQTQTLRAFLNEIAAFQLPLIVRSVEVEPVPAETAAATAPPEPGAPVPLVTQNFSKFAVVLEFVEVLSDPPSPPTP